jgi:hypothetical protein
MDESEVDHRSRIVRPAGGRVLHWFTVGVCALAATGEMVLACTSTPNLTPGDAVLYLALIAAPYLFLALYAWLQRHRRAASRVLFLVTVALAALALPFVGFHGYQYHTKAWYTEDSRKSVMTVACLRWPMTFLFGLAVVVAARTNTGRFDAKVRRNQKPLSPTDTAQQTLP